MPRSRFLPRSPQQHCEPCQQARYQRRSRQVASSSSVWRCGCRVLLDGAGYGQRCGCHSVKADSVGSDWVLNGEKAWVTNAAGADLFAVWAQTDAAAGSRGIAGFLVEREAEGLTVTDPYKLMGGHAMGTAGILLRAWRVPADGLISPPGEGFQVAMQGLTAARISVGAQCCGIWKAGLERAIGYVSRRKAL